MEKEIHDQPDAVAQTLLGRSDINGKLTLDELRIDPELLKQVNKIIVLACGTVRLRRAGGQVRHRALVPDPHRGGARPTSSATATRSWTRTP